MLFFESPQEKSSRPANALIGHAVGLLARIGWLYASAKSCGRIVECEVAAQGFGSSEWPARFLLFVKPGNGGCCGAYGSGNGKYCCLTTESAL